MWDPLDEVRPEAHVTLRSDRPVEAQVADLMGLLDGRIGLLAAARDDPVYLRSR